MMLWFLQQLLVFRKFSRTANTPHHVALACSLGLVLGLIPKGNLLAVLISLAILSLRSNLPFVMASTLVFSLLGRVFDPLTHQVGVALLSHEGLRPFWESFYARPLVPWTALNNSVVLGSLICGTSAAPPAYLVSRLLCRVVLKRFSRAKREPAAEEAPASSWRRAA